MAAATYPVRVDATLDRPLSRWLWLVKWFLAIPHYIVLAFLWMSFVVVSILAFFAILVTGRYPRALFDFNVGVLRWSWRVSYYTYGALGTDRYPPFTLGEVPDYPAHLQIDYPERLSRGLVLVKWWLLAIPQYVVVGFFIGGAWVAWQSDNARFWGGGLIGILVLVAGVALAVTGSYPAPLYDLVLGLNRWVLRVAAYAGLMTDRYPPFRLDMGGSEPTAGTLTVPTGGPGLPPAGPAGHPGPPTGGPGLPPIGPAAGATTGPPPTAGARPTPAPESTGWSAGRVIAVVVGSVLALVSFGLLAGGGVLLWADRTQRDAAGFLTTGTHSFATSSRALVSEGIDLRDQGPDWAYSHSLLGDVRVRVTSTAGSGPVFVGIGRADDVNRYLSGVNHATVTDLANDHPTYVDTTGGAPSTPPARAGVWAVQTSGTGAQTLRWTASSGQWRLVVMNATGRPDVAVSADVGAQVPSLPWIATGLLAGGAVLLAGGLTAIIAGAPRQRPEAPPAGD